MATATAPGQARALFVGLCTLDVVQLAGHAPAANEKLTALNQAIAAGGPATNAAVTFAHLGGTATLLTGVGRHPLAAVIRADLDGAGVSVIDAATDASAPAVSSIVVIKGSPDRSVISTNAARRRLTPPGELDLLVARSPAVLIDGHHPELALAACRAARAHGRICILDGGSWKQNTSDLLAHVDVALCSADFRPPGVSPGEILDYLLSRGVTWAAISNGAAPVAWAGHGTRGQIEVPRVKVADTVAAGDVLHGAFTYEALALPRLDVSSFSTALRNSISVAAYACQFFGTRAWLNAPRRSIADAD